MTQEDVFYACKVNIGRIERAEVNPTVSTLYQIAVALNVEITELFKFDGESAEKWQELQDELDTAQSQLDDLQKQRKHQEDQIQQLKDQIETLNEVNELLRYKLDKETG